MGDRHHTDSAELAKPSRAALQTRPSTFRKAQGSGLAGLGHSVLLRRQEPREIERSACGPRLLPSQEHERFGETATRLSGLMGVLFHWTPQQFWEATPQEVAVLFEALADLGRDGEGGAVAPPDMAAMAALKARFPD